MNTEQLVNRQYDLAKEIRQFIENCKKAPKERRTSQFFTSKIQRLQELGQELHHNNSEILALKELPTDDSYFTSSHYNETSKLVIDYTKTLEKLAMELSNEGNATGLTKSTVTNDANSGSSESTLKRLMRNIKALILALNQNLEEITSKQGEQQSQPYYTIKSAILEKQMINLTQNNNALWEATDESQVEDYTLQVYYEMEAKVEAALIELQQHINLEIQPVNASMARMNDSSGSSIQLPRISLPKFNGDYLQWVSFKDLFSELVHQSSISDAQKMQYLAQSLMDEPKNLIKHLPSTGSNYSAAWNILTNRYDNKRLLVSTLLNKLLLQPSAKSESPASLKSLHDVTRECLHGLRSQGLPVQHWDSIIAHIVLRKLDQATQTVFEQSIDDCRRLITLDEVLRFLERRFQSLEVRSNAEKSVKRTCGSAVNNDGKCLICKRDKHFAHECAVFKKAHIKQKWHYIKVFRLCANCLKTGHQSNTCKAGHCTKCTRRHNTLLHPEENKPQGEQTKTSSLLSTTVPEQATEQPISNTSNAVSLLTNQSENEDNFVLLGTAKVLIIGENGYHVECKAVLDSGSQVNLVTERLLKKLGTSTRASQMQLEGIGLKDTAVRHRTVIQIQSKINGFTAEIDAHVIPKIVSDQPAYHIKTEEWNIPKDIILADPEFDKPGRIDCLLGADIFFDLLTNGKLKLGENLPTLKNTAFGWVVAGNVGTSHLSNAVCGICTTSEIESMVSKFWQLEEVTETNAKLTEDDIRCETHFLQNTTRAKDQKFMVKLPLKEHPSSVGDTRELAYHRLKNIEKRLSDDSNLRTEYCAFMRQYESLGHMTEVDIKKISKPHYYIPHHCVLRPESTSTKLRVVFDASAHRAASLSLNDIMYNGPTVQSELFSILLRFRTYKYVLKTDIEKMYRQIWVHPEDRNLQLIMWRENPFERVKIYQLNTVTYGTRSAPYLATRCLNQLADDNMIQFPEGAHALKHNFYVDDGLVGANSLREAITIQQQLTAILGSAGMKLKKWCANNPKLLQEITSDDLEIELDFTSDDVQKTKTLGLTWLPKSDILTVKSGIQNSDSNTKRSVTSDIARIYDPLGLVGPVIVTAKIFIQKLWQLKYDWDEKLPMEFQKSWDLFRHELPILENAKIRRHVFGDQDYLKFELHAFADASERAYGAAIYIRTVSKDHTVKVNLLCSKSRVAPLKLQTIPKLELCAALLASELVARVKTDLHYETKETYFWSDSQIVLSWINHHPGTLPPFVAHRIIKIRQTSAVNQWHHVSSKENPADILSRGIRPHELSSAQMWFYGPLFLYQQRQSWPQPFNQGKDVPVVVSVATRKPDLPVESCWIYSIPSKNSFRHIQQTVGYMLRFAKNARTPKELRSEYVNLSPMELDAALKVIVRQVQSSDFGDVLKIFSKERFLPRSHHLSSLAPFLDEDGIIRVGGRISSSSQQYDANHQMILPNNDPLVMLLIEKVHKENYHCGPQALLAQLRQRFWPMKGKSMVRAVVQRCVRCTRARPALYSQFMGNLPPHRVEMARPFLHAGVDYCGPFWVHYKSRGKRPQKAYLAVFCCFATKAVHLELVTDLTTDAFIGALKRFVGRRGHCKALYCDNATNFVGAKNQLQELNDVIYAPNAKESIIAACSIKGIEFNFIPPRSPHFGGLWEAAVKSAKHLLIKNVATANLTYEELETIIVEIEAMLNSRPLTPIPSDPNDLNALTPGHALIGDHLTSNVDVHSESSKGKMISRWRQVSELKHQFWKRWSTEYLNELQQRHKWKGPISNVQLNTLVIMKEDNMPVLQWPLGRIIKVYTGDDGIVRVCDVKTQKGVFKRAVHKLAPLFPEEQTNIDQAKQDITGGLEEVSKLPAEDHEDMDTVDTLRPQQRPSLLVSIPLSRLRKAEPINEMPRSKTSRLQHNLLFTVIALFMLPLAFASPIKIQRFNTQPGIYFEQIGSVRLSTTNWDMFVYYDLEPYRNELEILQTGTRNLENLCSQTTSDTTCKFLVSYFKEAEENLNTKFGLLNTRRIKRGAVDIVGNLANNLFGVLDSNYEAKMSETIKELRADDHQLEKLLKNQTSLIDSTINIMKTTQMSSKAKFDEIDNRINSILYGHALDTPLGDIHASNAILTLTVHMFIIISTLQRTQAAIMDVLIDSHHGKINPLLLTPRQLTNEITKIKSYLSQQLQLPVETDNLLQIYKLLTVEGMVAESHILFRIQLPLSDARDFQLYNIVPVITIKNGSLITVKTTVQLLAVSPHRDDFFSLSDAQLESCIKLKSDSHLCHNVQASYHKTARTSSCEIDLFTNETEPRCEFEALKESTVWYQLKHQNQWIYATNHTIKLNAVCDESTFQLNLKESGMIQLQPKCVIKNEHITIQGHQDIQTKLYTSYKGTGISITSQVQRLNASTIIKSQPFQPTINELNSIQQQLKFINQSTLPTHGITYHHHGLIIGYIISALTIGVFIRIIWHRCGRAQHKTIDLELPNQQPTPMPRQIFHVTEC